MILCDELASAIGCNIKSEHCTKIKEIMKHEGVVKDEHPRQSAAKRERQNRIVSQTQKSQTNKATFALTATKQGGGFWRSGGKGGDEVVRIFLFQPTESAKEKKENEIWHYANSMYDMHNRPRLPPTQRTHSRSH